MLASDIWTLIDRVPALLPFSVDKVATVLGVKLVKKSENEYFSFYEGGGAVLPDGVVIEKVDLRIRKVQPHPGLLVLSVAGTCVKQGVVDSRYPNMVMTEHPRGRSIHDVAAYSHAAAWGKLGFSFPEREPYCLGAISFHPNA